MKLLSFAEINQIERNRAAASRAQATRSRSTSSIAGLPTKAIARRPASMSGEGGFSTGIGQGVGFGIGLLIFGTVFTLIKTSRT
jgi:hypothetical protein